MMSKAFPIFSLNLKFSLEPKALPRDSMGLQNFPKFYKVVYMFLLGLKSFHMFSLQPKTVCRRLKVFWSFSLWSKHFSKVLLSYQTFPGFPLDPKSFYSFHWCLGTSPGSHCYLSPSTKSHWVLKPCPGSHCCLSQGFCLFLNCFPIIHRF